MCLLEADDAETKADVNLGNVLDISIFAEAEALVVISSANLRIRSLSKSLSFDRDEDKRAFLWLSERNEGRSAAKCSLLRSLKKAKMEEERFIPSTRELPKNLLMPLKRSGSAGSKSVLRISLESQSRSQLEKDCVACKPCRAFSILMKSSIGILIEDFEATGL